MQSHTHTPGVGSGGRVSGTLPPQTFIHDEGPGQRSHVISVPSIDCPAVVRGVPSVLRVPLGRLLNRRRGAAAHDVSPLHRTQRRTGRAAAIAASLVHPAGTTTTRDGRRRRGGRGGGDAGGLMEREDSCAPGGCSAQRSAAASVRPARLGGEAAVWPMGQRLVISRLDVVVETTPSVAKLHIRRRRRRRPMRRRRRPMGAETNGRTDGRNDDGGGGGGRARASYVCADRSSDHGNTHFYSCVLSALSSLVHRYSSLSIRAHPRGRLNAHTYVGCSLLGQHAQRTELDQK